MFLFLVSLTIKYERMETIIMARPNVIESLPKDYLEEVIPKLVNKGGQKLAAKKLKTSTVTISRWLKRNGYSQKIIWVKRGEVEAAS